MKYVVTTIAAAALLASTAAYAGHSKGHAKAKDPAAVAAQSEKSKKCSADADAKKLHGKARREFRKTCMKAA